MSNLTMYDAITKYVSDMPINGDIYAGYDDGSFNDVNAIIARFPTKPVMSIDVTGAHQAQVLDVENLDATVADIDPWLADFALIGPVFDSPIIYMSVNTAKAAFPSTHPNGCLLWTAHYTGIEPHICGPNTCGLLPYNADMTQWKSVTDYDQSSVNPEHYIWKGPPMTDVWHGVAIMHRDGTETAEGNNWVVPIESTDEGVTFTPTGPGQAL